jgi:hypothetical protein
MVDCNQSISDYIPPFEKVWNIVKKEDTWSHQIDDAYDRICRKMEIDSREDCEENDEAMKETEKLIRKEAEEIYDDIVSVIENSFSGRETITIFRSMRVIDTGVFVDGLKKTGKTLYEGKMQGVGIYWAWDIMHAESHWGIGDEEVILEAEASCDIVDYEGTVLAYMSFGKGLEYDEESENEIRLLENRQVKLKHVFSNVVNINTCRGRKTRITADTVTFDMKNAKIWT